MPSQDLQEETQIPQDQLVRVLQTMTLRRAQYRVLSWDTKSEQTNFGERTEDCEIRGEGLCDSLFSLQVPMTGFQ